jgi:hypothetical protein
VRERKTLYRQSHRREARTLGTEYAVDIDDREHTGGEAAAQRNPTSNHAKGKGQTRVRATHDTPYEDRSAMEMDFSRIRAPPPVVQGAPRGI